MKTATVTKGSLSGTDKGRAAIIEGKRKAVIKRTEYQSKKRKQDTSLNRGENKEDFMNLTRYEQEVVINFNAEEDTATVYTANPTWLRKMEALAKEFPDTFCLIRQTEISRTYEMPKRLVRIGKPRELSSAQRENLIKMRNAKKQMHD
jgi:hypothetical protein